MECGEPSHVRQIGYLVPHQRAEKLIHMVSLHPPASPTTTLLRLILRPLSYSYDPSSRLPATFSTFLLFAQLCGLNPLAVAALFDISSVFAAVSHFLTLLRPCSLKTTVFSSGPVVARRSKFSFAALRVVRHLVTTATLSLSRQPCGEL